MITIRYYVPQTVEINNQVLKELEKRARARFDMEPDAEVDPFDVLRELRLMGIEDIHEDAIQAEYQ